MNGTGETLKEWLSHVYQWLAKPLFTVGNTAFNANSLLKLLAFVIIVVWVSRLLRRTLLTRLFPRLGVETGLSHALSNIVAYTTIFLGLLVGLQASGVELQSLTVLFGALGVGIGFSLQTVTSNFVSGLIILLERPIQVGDRIQVGNLHGRVVRIRIRATEILTNDNIAVIVPNSEFISQQVVNWSHGGNWIRVHIPIGVAYGSNCALVKQALLEAAASVDSVLKKPTPTVRLTGFGDSSIDFELLAWTTELLHQRDEFVSRVNFAIHESLENHKIQIPFPQRDLHLKSTVPLNQ